MSRRRKNGSPANLRREATRAVAQAHALAVERQDAWREGGHPNVVCRTTTDLERVFVRLRNVRRAMYEKGYPEGDPFVRSVERAMAEVFAVRSTRKREGEVPVSLIRPPVTVK